MYVCLISRACVLFLFRLGSLLAGYDVHRLRTSYPHLPALQEGGAWGGAASDNVVEILKVARKLHTQVRKMRKRRPPLKDIHKRVLKT